MELIFLPLMFLLMWLLFIRPQQQRVRRHQELVNAVAAGDEVVTAGGIVGTVRAVDAEHLKIEVAHGVELRVLKGAISRRVSEAPTAKALDDPELDLDDLDLDDPELHDDPDPDADPDDRR